MTCITGISKNITSDCSTQKSGGLEVKAWIFNRAEFANAITFDATNGNKITSIASVLGKKAYVLTGTKRMLNAGHDAVVADNRPDKYTHHAMFDQFELAAEDVANMDNTNDIFIVFERKDKETGGDGTFVAYGVKNGLWKTSDTRRANDSNGARVMEFASLSGQEEPYSEYTVLSNDYDTTLAMLVALETAGV